MNSAAHDDLADLLGPIDPIPGSLSGVAPSPRPVASLPPETASAGHISEAELSDLLDLTSRRVRDLVTDGVIPRKGRGATAFDRRAAVRAYCIWIRDKASRGVAVMDELKAEKIRQAREAADKLALQNAAARGELVPSSEVESAWANVLRDVRSMMLAVPSRCGASLAHLTPHDVAAIDREIKSALEGLADGDA